MAFRAQDYGGTWWLWLKPEATTPRVKTLEKKGGVMEQVHLNKSYEQGLNLSGS